MPTKPGALGNASVNEPNMGLFSAVLAQGDRLAQEFIATVALLDGDAVVMDPATGPNNVTKAALADTTRRVGVCMGGAAVGAPAWIVMKGPYPAISDGTAGDIGRRSETITLSHEMAETQTDPDGAVLSFGWFDNSNLSHGEIGDLCEGTEARLDGYSIQRMWSNEQSACVASGPQASHGGGCPAGMHSENGYCVPDTPVGCASAATGWPALAVLISLLALRRAAPGRSSRPSHPRA